jgi:peptidoglycan/xylan/chitin deacetylase (PgdA/CDA1 family)
MGITVDQFSQFLQYFLKYDYNFITPNDVIKGLNPNKKYIMVTFDDGYFNNIHILPVLKKYKIPAVFFIPTNNIIKNKSFWWDVLYRQRIKTGLSMREIINEGNQLKAKKNQEIEQYLIDRFGEKAFHPISDIDRPFTPMELKKISQEKYVLIGNHTSDHAILTNYNLDEINSQMRDAQDYINHITGSSPIIISFPDGKYSDEVIKVSKQIGFQLGFTGDFKKNYLPLNSNKDNYMHLGRFDMGRSNEIFQLFALFRSDTILIYKQIDNFLKRGY